MECGRWREKGRRGEEERGRDGRRRGRRRGRGRDMVERWEKVKKTRRREREREEEEKGMKRRKSEKGGEERRGRKRGSGRESGLAWFTLEFGNFTILLLQCHLFSSRCSCFLLEVTVQFPSRMLINFFPTSSGNSTIPSYPQALPRFFSRI
ncbi:hypothetical protein BJX96DRAFT_19737 [Aspergillus floccosus]